MLTPCENVLVQVLDQGQMLPFIAGSAVVARGLLTTSSAVGSMARVIVIVTQDML